MTKQEVITQVSERTGLDQLTSRSVIESFCEVVKDSLTAGESIYIRSFGTFTLKRQAPKMARNIQRNTVIRVSARTVPFFKPSLELVKLLKEQNRPVSIKKGNV